MTVKGRLLILCSAAAAYLGMTILPALAENTTAHRESKMMRYHVKHHHKNAMFRRAKR